MKILIIVKDTLDALIGIIRLLKTNPKKEDLETTLQCLTEDWQINIDDIEEHE